MSKLITCIVLLLPAAAAAQSSSCRLVSAASLAFGSYDAMVSTPTDTLTNVIVQCTRDGGPHHVTVTLGLDRGLNGTSVNDRRLSKQGGGDSLSYGLFRDASRSMVWGFSAGIDAASRTFAVPNNKFASETFTIYGRIPPQQNVSVGSYSDSVQITLMP